MSSSSHYKHHLLEHLLVLQIACVFGAVGIPLAFFLIAPAFAEDSVDFQIGMSTTTPDNITVTFGGADTSSIQPPPEIFGSSMKEGTREIFLITESLKKLESTRRELLKSKEKLLQTDAESLEDSERLKAASRVLEQAERNCGDTVSLVKTADTGLGEISGIIVSLRELVIQVGAGTVYPEAKEAVKKLNEEAQKLDKKITGGETKNRDRALVKAQQNVDKAIQKASQDIQKITSGFFGVGASKTTRRLSVSATKSMIDTRHAAINSVARDVGKIALATVKEATRVQKKSDQIYEALSAKPIPKTDQPVVPDLAPLTTPVEDIKDIVNIEFSIKDAELEKRQVNGVSIALDGQTPSLTDFSHGGMNLNGRGLAVGDWVCILPSATLWRCQGRDVMEIGKTQVLTMYFSKLIEHAPSTMSFNLLHDAQVVGTLTIPRQVLGSTGSSGGSSISTGGGLGGGFIFSQ